MKRQGYSANRRAIAAAAALVSVLAAIALPNLSFAFEPKESLEDIEFPPIEIRRSEPHFEELENGIRLFVLENDQLPLVDISVLVRTGKIYEPGGRAGLADATGRVLRTGGTESMPWSEVDESVDAMAARFRTWIGLESGGAYMNVHSSNLDRAIEILKAVSVRTL